MSAAAQPLAGVRVLDLSDGKGEMCGRYLADLGADVVLVESPEGSSSRRRGPLVDGHSLYFASHSANKRSVVVDLATADGREQLLTLAGQSDIVIETTRPGTLEPLGLGADDMLGRNPGLVVLSITDFGQYGPYRDFTATNDTHMAMGGVLCRSGLPGLPPLLPPGEMAYESTAVQAAWCALLAYLNALKTGRGDHLDFSVFEATAQILDPGLGVTGSAAAGASAMDSPRGRPDGRHLYPIFACADGHVRICVLSPRQWRGMLAFLGSPEELTDPSFDNIVKRFGNWPLIHGYIERHFADKPAAELVATGQQLGVPIAQLLTPAEVLRNEHFDARGAFVDVDLGEAGTGRMPSGYVEVNGARAGYRTPAPRLGEHTRDVVQEWTASRDSLPDPRSAAELPERVRPLEALRVLDLGVIVAGAESGRLFADQGADVIKVENKGFPDGARQSLTGEPISPSFAQGHRGKRGLGLDLRDLEGKRLFLQLVRDSDVVLSNFKPGTMDSLGLGYEVLREVNPRVVMVDSSALGSTGPWSKTLGYGPLVRASSSLTALWRYGDVEDSFSDAVTIYPDHLAARVAGVAALALLIQRERTGVGGTVSVAQAEVILTGRSHQFLQESFQPGSFGVRSSVGASAVGRGVYPCAGDDDWCVIDVRDTTDFQALFTAIGESDIAAAATLADSSERLAHREELEDRLRTWTAKHSADDVQQTLQAAGVPAGKMQRLTEYLDNPQFRARDFIRHLDQPQLSAPLPTENAPCLSRHIASPDLRAAPLAGEHTYEIATGLLGLPLAEIQRLVERGVLQPSSVPVPA